MMTVVVVTVATNRGIVTMMPMSAHAAVARSIMMGTMMPAVAVNMAGTMTVTGGMVVIARLQR